jgi:outer membrane lipoprotein SlyB
MNRKLITAAMITAGAMFASPVFAVCDNCGTVTNLKTVTKEGEASGGGAVVGGIVGGVLGHQVGSGRGNTVATVAGAAGGAYAGHQIEKKKNEKTVYQVLVKMENGNERTFEYSQATAYKIGDKVQIVDKKLVKQ